ncbi:hypothetical protein HU200_019654 [Digitaria exilis]|uniref:Uncharacterized protein n=1 Tax=Digitaria exilis TaxID=1010633 RepID=A0A835F2V6_9POAL|nr:hypothetical protein HU200_019654 [Digitaria exilis]CAB3467374.1 unnamed protein product [Digitaria exilis]CAB3469892.1 unnamed protein product [Digitaria exilis]
MAASVTAAARLALAVALGCAYILAPILESLDGDGVSPCRRSPVLDAAASVVLVTLPITYLLGVVLVYLHVTPAPPPLPQGVSRRLAGLASALVAVLAVALVAFCLLRAGVSPPGCAGQ